MRAITPSDIVARAAAAYEAMRAKGPRVHCLTNTVAQAFTANLLLAAGAVPSMTVAPDEIGAFVTRADAVLINLGTFDAERRRAVTLALDVATEAGTPWVLDPVLIDRSPARAALARDLLACGPRAIRANGAEIAALIATPDDLVDVDVAARRALSVIALTGAVDHVTDGGRRVRVANGHPWMARVTAVGCALGGLVAAVHAVEDDAFVATAAAVIALGVAGGIAGERAGGPGSFAAGLLDALDRLDPATLAARVRLED